jgi:hypothetical protein
MDGGAGSFYPGQGPSYCPGSSRGGSQYGGGSMNGGAASFYSGQGSHYYQNMRGEWEDDDF